MATVINDNFKLQAPKPIESRYAKFAGGISIPYASVAEANSLIPMAYRYQGLTVLILENSKNVEYSYQGGVADINLVFKAPGTERRIKQTAHGFQVGYQVAEDNSQVWHKASAVSETTAVVHGTVTAILDADNFIVGNYGTIFSIAGLGLPANVPIFLAVDSGGVNYSQNLVQVPGQVQKVVFRTISTTKAIVTNEPAFTFANNAIVIPLSFATFAAIQTSGQPAMIEVINDETNSNLKTVYYYSGTNMYRVNSVFTGTTTTTTSSGTTTTTTSGTTTTGGTTTTTTAATTTTTTTAAISNQDILISFLNPFRSPDEYAGVAGIIDAGGTAVAAGNAGRSSLKDITNTPTGVSFQLTSPGIASANAPNNGPDPNSNTVFGKDTVAAFRWNLSNGGTFRLSGLSPNTLHRCHFWSSSYPYEASVCNFTATGATTATTPNINTSNNYGDAAGDPLLDPALVHVDVYSNGSGIIDFTAHYVSGDPSAGVPLTAMYVQRIINGTTTTSTTGGTTTTTTGATTTTTTGGTTTTTTTAAAPTVEQSILFNFLNEFRNAVEYAGVVGINNAGGNAVQNGTAGADNVIDMLGAATTVDFHLTSAGIGDQGAPSNGADPSADNVFGLQNIMAYSWILNDNGTFRISGLIPGRTYRAYVAGNNNSWEAKVQRFELNGVMSADQNTSNNFGTAAGDPRLDPALTMVEAAADGSGNIDGIVHNVSGNPGFTLTALLLDRMSAS
jgi:hypothetical protein